jgi:hypothetical protein
VTRLPLRHPSLALVVVILASLAVAACTAGAGPLGTPASPVVSPDGSEAPPSDVAPDSPTPEPTVTPTEAPSTDPSGGPSSTPGPTESPSPTESAEATTIVRSYFFLGSFTDNAGIVPVLREIPETRAVAATAVRELLQGPRGVEVESSPAMYSAIPEGTRLIDVSIDDQVATVQLSEAWNAVEASAVGDAARAQLVYTLTQFPSVRSVRVQVGDDGPVEHLGRRSDYQEIGLLPAIFVDRPAWGAAAGNPARVSGIANVFEATLQVELLDGRGDRLAEETVTATCGTGCWGTFRTDLAYDISKAQYGTLRVYSESAKDGSRENVTEYRVWLTP